MILSEIAEEVGGEWDGDKLRVVTDSANLVITEFDDGVLVEGESSYDGVLPVRYRFADMSTAWTVLVPAVLYLLDGEVRI